MSDNSGNTAAILRQMALGNDPATGVALPAAHVLHRPEVIRALILATEAVETSRRSGIAAHRPLRAGVAWSQAEDKELFAMFHQGQSVTQIAKAAQRSTGSITSRLAKLGLLDDFQVILEGAKAERRSKMKRED